MHYNALKSFLNNENLVRTSVSAFGSDSLLSCTCKLSQVVHVHVVVLYKVSCFCHIAHAHCDFLSKVAQNSFQLLDFDGSLYPALLTALGAYN